MAALTDAVADREEEKVRRAALYEASDIARSQQENALTTAMLLSHANQQGQNYNSQNLSKSSLNKKKQRVHKKARQIRKVAHAKIKA